MTESPMSDSGSEPDLFEALAEEFLERQRRGERPDVAEYARRYPQWADRIRKVLGALALLEDARPAGESTGSVAQPALGDAVPTPAQLGDYRILREVGRGGMGVVYEAEQVSLGRHVALKVLPHRLPDDRARLRFEREAKAAARLHHTNIVPVFGVGDHDGLPYYVMQFIQGLGLDEVLRELKRLRAAETGRGTPEDGSAAAVARSLWTGRFTPAATADHSPAGDAAAPHSGTLTPSSSSAVLPGAGPGKRPATYWQSVARIGVQVADALDYAHRQGIRHRDVKPSNLLLDTHGTVWVTDFGLAKADNQQNLTHTGDILGTLRYLPPEAFDGKADARGDVYSLGLTLYELLAFRPAFDAREHNQLVKQVTGADPAPLRRLNPAVPRDLATVVHKAIERDPARRYPTAGELAADLQRFLDDVPVRARRSSPAERLVRWCRHHPAVAALVAVVQLALLGLLGMAWWSKAQIDRALADKENERSRAVAKEKEALDSRDAAVAEAYHALANHTRALRLARSPGWRDTAFQNLRRLLEIDTPQRDLRLLRGEAVACLAEVDVRPRQVFRDLRMSVWSVQFSPDGKSVAATDFSGTVLLRDTAGGQAVTLQPGSLLPSARFHTPAAHLPAVRFHPGGGWVAFTRPGKGVELRGLGAGRPPVPRLEGPAPARNLAFDAKGSLLAVSWADGRVRVYDAATGEVRRTVATGVPAGWFYRPVALSPDGTRLAAVGPNNAVQIHRLDTEQPPALPGRHRGPVRGLTFSPDGHYLASASHDRSVKIWEVATAQEHLTLQGHGTAANAIAYSPGGNLIATVSDDQTLRLWDARTGQPLQVIYPDLGNLLAVSFSPDGTRLAVSSGIPGHKVGVFEVAVPRVRQRLAGHKLRNLTRVTGLAFHPREALLASGGADQQVILHDLAAGRPARVWLKEPDNPVGAIAFSPDGRWLAAAPNMFDSPSPTSDLAVRLIEPGTGQVRRLLWQRPGDRQPSNPAHVRSCAFDPAGRLLAVGGGTVLGTGSVLVWDVASGEPVHRWQPLRTVQGVAFAAGGKHLVAGDVGGRIRLLDVADGTIVREADVPASADLDLAVTPDGRRLVVAANDTLYVFGLPGLELTATLKGAHAGPLTRVAVSGCGRLLASGGNDRQVILWDARSLDRLVTLPPHSSDVESLAFSADGARLAVGGRDEFVTLWDLGLLRRGLAELALDWK